MKVWFYCPGCEVSFGWTPAETPFQVKGSDKLWCSGGRLTEVGDGRLVLEAAACPRCRLLTCFRPIEVVIEGGTG